MLWFWGKQPEDAQYLNCTFTQFSWPFCIVVTLTTTMQCLYEEITDLYFVTLMFIPVRGFAAAARLGLV